MYIIKLLYNETKNHFNFHPSASYVVYSTNTQLDSTFTSNAVEEVTGGVSSGYGMMMDFKLPNTRFPVINSTTYYVRPASYDDSNGQIPNYLVETTELDFINENDRILDYTIHLIKTDIRQNIVY